jgi:hypothetical protein
MSLTDILCRLGYIHPVRVCKNCYANRELVEMRTTGDTSTVKVAAATFTKYVPSLFCVRATHRRVGM